MGFVLLCIAKAGHAQVYPLQTMYFQNQYLYNPALAGMDNKVNLNIDYRQQWNNFPGAPKLGSFTADFEPGKNVGLGAQVSDEQFGLIRETRVMATYAYHVPLNGANEHLNFGLSLGINNSRLNTNAIVGDQTDPEIAQYSQLKPYFDGDAGVAYTSDGFSIGATLPNIRATFFNSSDQRFVADQLRFMALASYKIPLNTTGDYILEPLAAYRNIRGYQSIVDVGANIDLKSVAGIYFQGLYQSNHSMNFGFGFNQGTYGLNFAYGFETGAVDPYTNGSFQLGIKLRF